MSVSDPMQSSDEQVNGHRESVTHDVLIIRRINDRFKNSALLSILSQIVPDRQQSDTLNINI